ncbi:MAG: beta-lactamase family protein, partial [Saprospiraceae bacterium]|nr:beta-lactamase family protein [Saprospiraceae bacterium]
MKLSILQQLLPLLLWLPLTALQAQTADPVDQIFAEWQESADAPGGVFGIIEKGQVVMTRAYGKASLEYDIPNTRETAMNIASVSKQFTAYAMVLLEQQGKLSIDDEVRKYLPELPDFGTPITIRHLLTHTSGLRNFQNLLALAGWRDGDYMTNDDLVRYMSMQRELNFPVGSEYLYCNSGFNLCTEIVKRVTGQSFEDWTREHIFQPLGMNRSEFRSDMQEVVKQTATSYDKHPDGSFTQPLKYWTYTGNGNIYTTVDDLARWIRNFDEGTLGGKAALERLSERGILTNGDTLTYA